METDPVPNDVQHMTQALETLGWNQNELASRLGVTAKQVSLWKTGKVRVPKYAMAYLALSVLWQKACERFPMLLH